MNRAKNALILTDAELSFGLEGGVTEIDDDMYVCNWGALTVSDGTMFTVLAHKLFCQKKLPRK